MATKVMLSARTSVNSLNSLLRGALNRQYGVLGLQLSNYRTYSTAEADDEDELDDDYEGFSEDEEPLVDVAKLQDVSRIKRSLHARMEHVLDAEYYTEPNQYFKELKWFKAHAYARFGKASGLDPGQLWPDKYAMQKLIAEDKQFESTLQERWQKLAADAEAKDDFLREREALIESRIGKMPQYIEQYKARMEKEKEAEAKIEAKRQALIEDARAHYGYNLDKKDPKLAEFKKMRAEEESLAKKQRKKELKQDKVMTRLQKMAMERKKEAKLKTGAL